MKAQEYLVGFDDGLGNEGRRQVVIETSNSDDMFVLYSALQRSCKSVDVRMRDPKTGNFFRCYE